MQLMGNHNYNNDEITLIKNLHLMFYVVKELSNVEKLIKESNASLT